MQVDVPGRCDHVAAPRPGRRPGAPTAHGRAGVLRPARARHARAVLAGLILFWMLWAIPSARAGRCEGSAPSAVQLFTSAGESPRANGWTEQERWVWLQVVQNREADLDRHAGDGAFDPRAVGEVEPSPRRKLRACFLADVLTAEEVRKVAPANGVHIKGAWFDGAVDLSSIRFDRQFQLSRSRFDGPFVLANARLDDPVWLEDSFFQDKADLGGVKVGGVLSVKGSVFARALRLDGAVIGGSLWLDGKVARCDAREPAGGETKGEFRGDVTLVEARVRGQLTAACAAFRGQLDLNSADIGLSALFTHSDFDKTVRLRDAKVGLLLDLSASEFGAGLPAEGNADALDLGAVKVGSNLLLGGCATYKRGVTLAAAEIGGTLFAARGRFERGIEMGGLRTRQSVFLGELRSAAADQGRSEEPACGSGAQRGAVVQRMLSLVDAKIAGALNMSHSKFDDVLLKNAQIGGALDLQDVGLLGSLELSGTTVASELLMDRVPADLSKLDLVGLRYERVGPTNGNQANLASWGAWVSKQEPYSPQPYEQLASVLRQMGDQAGANQILFDSADRARKEQLVTASRTSRDGGAWPDWFQRLQAWLTYAARQVFLWAYGFAVGYGYYPYRAFAWAAAFVGLGVVVFQKSKMPDTQGTGLSYSFDRFIPFIQLRDRGEDVALRPWGRRYFYLHKFAGVLLAGFMAAALSGLVPK